MTILKRLPQVMRGYQHTANWTSVLLEIEMKPTEELIAEHNAVLVALQILEKVEERLVAEDADAPEHLNQLIDFFGGFVDRCHHAKEEDALFPELEKCGVKREGGPIGVMLAEHEAGRGLVREMAHGLARLRRDGQNASAGTQETAIGYRNLLSAHIQKENTVLFPMADRLLSEEIAEKVVARFEEIELNRVGPGKHEAYHGMLHRLKEIYRV
jgi:hemerythrin-like domain-containing protein